MQLPLLEKDARFSCGSCTSCCDQPWRTLIESEKARALDRHDFSKYPQLAGRSFYHPPADGREHYFDLAKGEGTRCLFLDTDGLCIIHKELGSGAKPGMCLQFPYLPSRTWTDDRISLNYGCPSAQQCKGKPLDEQEDQIACAVRPSMRPHKGTSVPIALDTSTALTHEEYEAVMDQALAIFREGPDGDVWSRFAELIGLLMAVREFKQARATNGHGLVEMLERNSDAPLGPQTGLIQPFARPEHAPMPARMLFAATLYPDSLPAEQTGRIGILKRLTLMPRLMAMAKLSGVYASRALGRNLVINRVLEHNISTQLEPAATTLLLRYFRARLWQRLLVGTRLPVISGVHQHIHDFNAILFLSRAEAAQQGEQTLSEVLVRKALTCVEFHLANQPRVYDQTLKRWLRGQLADPALALQSLRLMALPQSAPTSQS